MTVTAPFSRTAVPAARPAPGRAAVALPRPRPRRFGVLRDRLRDHAALRREAQVWAWAAERAATPSARAELRTLREYRGR